MWALALSTGPLVIGGLSYRAGGPRLRLHSRRVSADTAGSPFPNGVSVTLTVVNSGRAPVTVEGFHVRYPAGRTPLAHIREADGPALPYRLGGARRRDVGRGRAARGSRCRPGGRRT